VPGGPPLTFQPTNAGGWQLNLNRGTAVLVRHVVRVLVLLVVGV
jgi:hypothetical protein